MIFLLPFFFFVLNYYIFVVTLIRSNAYGGRGVFFSVIRLLCGWVAGEEECVWISASTSRGPGSWLGLGWAGLGLGAGTKSDSCCCDSSLFFFFLFFFFIFIFISARMWVMHKAYFVLPLPRGT